MIARRALAEILRSAARWIETPHAVALRRRGVPIRLYQQLRQPWLQHLNIRTVLDIGANVGHFTLAAHAAFPEARIYSFEPLQDCFLQLQQSVMSADRFQAFNLGLGDTTGELCFERNAYSESSSFLEMTEVHKRAFPFTSESRVVTVPVEKLDNVARQIEIVDQMMIKIDVQGFEDRVLRGGQDTVQRAKLLVVETSFEPLYQGQLLFDGIYNILTDLGFIYTGTLDQIRHPIDGRCLQADSIFIRSTGY